MTLDALPECGYRDLLIEDLATENAALHARIVSLESDVYVHRGLVHAALDALHHSLRQREHLRQRNRALLDRLKQVRRRPS